MHKLETLLKGLHDERVADAHQLKAMMVEKESLKADKESLESERDALKTQVRSLRSEVSSLKDQVSSFSELSDATSKESDVLRERLDRVVPECEERLELTKAEFLRNPPQPTPSSAFDIAENTALLSELEAIRKKLDEKTEEVEEVVNSARECHEFSFDNCVAQCRLLYPSLDLSQLDPYKCVEGDRLVPIDQETYPLPIVLDHLDGTPAVGSDDGSHSDRSSPSPESYCTVDSDDGGQSSLTGPTGASDADSIPPKEVEEKSQT